MAAVQSKGVATTHRDYDAYSGKWKRARDVIGGQDAMHKASSIYLPKLKDETDADYKARVGRSDFFNATWRTIDVLGGLVFRKPPTVKVPKGIEEHLKDITMSGVSMEAFAKETVEEVLSVERIGILVDHPPAPENVKAISIAAAQALGLRPKMVQYPAESVRNWKFRRINNAWVLAMVVLAEQHEEPKDEFSDECVERFRVLDLDEANNYRQRVYERKDEKDILVEGPFYPLRNNKPLNSIPFRAVGIGGMNQRPDDPPTQDLIDKNVAHFQVNSDYRHGLHFAGLPTAVVSGYTPENKAEKLYIGSSTAWVFPDPNAKAEYLEFTGQGLSALENALDRIEKQMALLGARMLSEETRQAETATAHHYKRAGENSILAKAAQSVSEALEWALTEFAEWAGQPGEIVYQLNRDFMPAMMDAQTLNAIFAGVQSGNISKQEAFELLQRGDLIDGEKTYDEHQEQIDVDTPAPARPTAKPKPGEEMVA